MKENGLFTLDPSYLNYVENNQVVLQLQIYWNFNILASFSE